MWTPKALLALVGAQAVSAHFGLINPEWRGDTMSDTADPKFNQWLYPCAGVPYGNGNTTEWNGKSVTVKMGHHYSYIWLNVGLGQNTTDFNVTLTPQFLNVTGKGTICIDDLPWPKDIANGTVGTLQVVTSDKGSALYNCADFRYNSAAPGPSNCTRPDGVKIIKIKDQSNDTSSGSDSQGDHSNHGSGGASQTPGASQTQGSGGDKPGAAGIVSLNTATLTGLVAVGFAAAMLGL